MNNIFKYALMLACAGTMGMGLTACSDDDKQAVDDAMEEAAKNVALKNVTGTYINDVVYDTYGKLAAQSKSLYTKINAMRVKLNSGQTVTQAEVDAICDNYKAARKEWEESEAFLFGAAADFEIDPHIDTWPLDVETLAKDLSDDAKIKALNTDEGIEYARKNLTAENLGFHGIEFIFFRDGKNRDVAIFNNDAVENYEYKGTKYFSGMTVTGKEEVIFAAAVAGDLRDKCYQLEYAWLGSKASADAQTRIQTLYKMDNEEWQYLSRGADVCYGEDMLNAASGQNTNFASWRKVAEQIFSGCSDICAEVADQKMGQAYRSATDPEHATHEGEDGEVEKDDPNYIESPYSHNSFTDFYGNIQSIHNSLFGGRNLTTPATTSLMAYLTLYNSAEAATLTAKLSAAMLALNACQNSGKAFVELPASPLVGAAIQAIGELDDELNTAKDWVLKN